MRYFNEVILYKEFENKRILENQIQLEAVDQSSTIDKLSVPSLNAKSQINLLENEIRTLKEKNIKLRVNKNCIFDLVKAMKIC